MERNQKHGRKGTTGDAVENPRFVLSRLLSHSLVTSPLIFLLLAQMAHGQAQVISATTRKTPIVKQQFRNQPLSFEENRGQTDSRVKFLARGKGHTLFLTKDEAVLALRKGTSSVVSSQLSVKNTENANEAVLRMKFSGANPEARIDGEEPLPGKIYYADAHTTGSLQGSATFRRVKYSGVYPGIDAVYYGNERQLEFDFVIAPHTDPGQIRLSFAGAEKISLAESGEISLRVDGEEVRIKKPVIYQERNGIREEIAGGYRLLRSGAHEVAFTLGKYDAALPLVVDPVIAFGTYVGGAGDEFVAAVAVNLAGETYILGQTSDPQSLQAGTTFTLAPATSNPCFLSKISADGSSLLYSVIFLGTTGCRAMDVDSQDRVHLSLGANVFPGNLLRTLSRDSSGVLTLSPLHGAFDFQNGPVFHVKSDSQGNIYMVAFYQPDGTNSPGYYLLKVDSNGQLLGSQLIVTPVISGPNNNTFEIVTGMAADDQGQAFVVGTLGLGTIPTTANAFQTTRQDSCCTDGFVMQIDTSAPGFPITYASYLGGSADDRPTGIGRSSNGELYVTGTSYSLNFPTTQSAYQPASPQLGQNTFDTFLVKLALTVQPPSQQLVFGTWLGQVSSQPYSLVVLPGGIPVIAGDAPDFGFRLVGSQFPHVGFGGRTFAAAFSADGSTLLFASFLDAGTGISFNPLLANDGSQFLDVAMSTNEDGLGTAGAHQDFVAGGFDVIARKIDMSDILPANNPPQVTLTPSVDIVATSPNGVLFDLGCGSLISCFYFDPDGDPLEGFTWEGSNGFTTSAPDSPPGARIFLPIGNYTFTLAVGDVRGGVGTGTVIVNVLGQNTFTGGVPIVPLNDNSFDVLQQGFDNPVTITFGNVTSPGLTWVRTRVDQNPPAPADSQTGTPPVYYDISTDAGFTGVAQVCLNTRGMSFANPVNVQIYELQFGNWNPLGSTQQGLELCADTDFPGRTPGVLKKTTLAIFYPPVPETAITTIAGTGFFPGQNDGNPNGGPNSLDNFTDGGPAIESAIGSPFGGAVDRLHNYVYFASQYLAGGALYRLELNTGTIHRVAGTSFRPFTIDGPGNNPADDPVDGAAALQYPLNAPGAVAVDSAGNVYISERFHTFQTSFGLEFCGVLKFDVGANTISRVAGAPPAPQACGFSGDAGPATFALMGEIRAMTFDAAGNLFLADADNHRIRRVDAFTGQVDTVVGNGGSVPPDGNPKEALQTSLSGLVNGLAFDSQGFLVLSDNYVWRLAPSPTDGLIMGRIGAGEIIAPLLHCGLSPFPNCNSWPFGGDGLSVGEANGFLGGSLIVASDASILTTQGLRVRRVLPGTDRIITGNDSGETVQTVAGYEYDATSTVFGGTGTGGSGFFNGDMFATNSALAYPLGVLEDPRGGFLILDSNNRRIRHIGLAGSSTGGGQNADLSIVATAAPNPVATRKVLTYDPITVANAGPANASGVTLNFVIPSSAYFESATTGQGTCTTPAVGTSGTVTCDLGSIPSGGSVKVTVSVKPQTAGPLNAVLSVLGNETDSNPSNNIANLTTTVNLGTAVIDVKEMITVTDAPAILPSAIIPVAEIIKVTDTPDVLPSAMIPVSENIHVTDIPLIPDVTAPVVTPPSNITIAATELIGARGNVSLPLHTFLAGGSAVDDRDLNAARLADQADFGSGPVDVDDTVVFPIGSTKVTFRFKDAAGNIGAAAATLTVLPPVGAATQTGTNVVVPGVDLNGNPQPVTVSFATVTQPGLTTMTPIALAPPLPANFALQGIAYDVVTTALYTPPVLVCIDGSFVASDSLFHFQNNQWVDITNTRSSSQICGFAPSLSPFAVLRPSNHAPVATASAPATAEATSPAGATVTLAGSGTDQDAGDTLSFAWSEGATTLGAAAVITVTIPVGVHNLTLTVNDNHGASATASVSVAVQDTKPPVLLLPGNQTLDATSPAGAVATFTASANDVVDGSRPVLCALASGSTFPLGTTPVSCTAADTHFNAASGTFNITVRDTKPPVVTPPANITVPATEAGGARGSAWPALAAFLAGATAKDLVDIAPKRLAPVVGTTPVDNGTLFPIGTIVVTFSFRDASNNIASATASVKVILGTPKISGQVAAQGKNADGTFFVDVKLTNTGTGNARKMRAVVIKAVPTKGTGRITIVSPAFPMTIGIGNLDVGASQTVHVVLKVPATVTQFALAEGGDFVNVKGTLSLFVLAQTVTP